MSEAGVDQGVGGYGEHEAAMIAYREAGTERAMQLGNRGPIRYNADGSLHDDIVDASDPISDTPLENLAIEVNVAIQDGLRYLYLTQQPDGSWKLQP